VRGKAPGQVRGSADDADAGGGRRLVDRTEVRGAEPERVHVRDRSVGTTPGAAVHEVVGVGVEQGDLLGERGQLDGNVDRPVEMTFGELRRRPDVDEERAGGEEVRGAAADRLCGRAGGRSAKRGDERHSDGCTSEGASERAGGIGVRRHDARVTPGRGYVDGQEAGTTRTRGMTVPAPDLTMPRPVRAEFLAVERVLRLATVDEEGWPVVVPLWFVHHPDDDRGELWIWNLNRARRTRRLEAGGRSAITVDAGHDYAELRGLSARAIPTRVDDVDVPLAVRAAYARKYFGSDEPHAPASHHTWFALLLSHERSWDFRRIGA